MATVKIQSPQWTDVDTVGGEAVLATLQLQRDGRVTATTSGRQNYLGVAEILADVKLEHHFAIRKATYKPPPQSTPTP